MAIWIMLWKHPRRAYRLGGLVLLAGMGLGWLALREKDDVQARIGCVLGAAFCFALWSLLTMFGSLATYAAAVHPPRAEEPGPLGAARQDI